MGEFDEVNTCFVFRLSRKYLTAPQSTLKLQPPCKRQPSTCLPVLLSCLVLPRRIPLHLITTTQAHRSSSIHSPGELRLEIWSFAQEGRIIKIDYDTILNEWFICPDNYTSPLLLSTNHEARAAFLERPLVQFSIGRPYSPSQNSKLPKGYRHFLSSQPWNQL